MKRILITITLITFGCSHSLFAMEPSLNQQLIKAISESDLDQARQLIDAGADVSAPHGQGYDSPLVEAIYAEKNNVLMAKLLLERGASVYQQSSNLIPLHEAAQFSSPILEIMLKYATTIQYDADLFYAAYKQPNMNSIILLLSAGAKPSLTKVVHFNNGEIRFVTARDHAVKLADWGCWEGECMLAILDSMHVSPEIIANITIGLLVLKYAAPETFKKDVRGVIKKMLVQHVAEEKLEKIKAAVRGKDWDAIDTTLLQKAFRINIMRALRNTPKLPKPAEQPAL